MYKETIKGMVFREWNILDTTESNTILQSIIYQNWADSSPMPAWIWCQFPPSHGTFRYLYRDGIMLYGIVRVQWMKYPDKIFLNAEEWSGVLQQYVTEKYLTLKILL